LHQLLKVNKKKDLKRCKITEEMFKDDLSELFDLSTKDAIETMRGDEDKQFLNMQRDDVTSSSMIGVDHNLAHR